MGDVARLIQLAIAPIFLLVAVSGSLQVFSGRLTRIVDRGRALEKLPAAGSRDRELGMLERRARLIYWALVLGVTASLCVALLMMAAFAGALFSLEVSRAAAVLFLAALGAYVSALLCLLREVFLAVGHFRLGLQHSEPPSR